MSWVNYIWSITAGICLTFGLVHLLFWLRQRDAWANLAFSIAAMAAAGYATVDLLILHAETPSGLEELVQAHLVISTVAMLALAWFIRVHLSAGRLWLLGLICGLRAGMLVLNFVPGPTFYFGEVTRLETLSLLGESIVRPIVVPHPWAPLMQLSHVLVIVFIVDAARSAAKRDRAKGAWGFAGVIVGAMILTTLSSVLRARGVLPTAFTGQLMLLPISWIASRLSMDLVRASQLAKALRASEEHFRLAASATNLGVWDWDIARDAIHATAPVYMRLGHSEPGPLDFHRYLESVHPEDRQRLDQSVRATFDGDPEFEAEYRVITTDDGPHWISARGRLERGPDGSPIRLRGISLDITDRKRAESEMEQLRRDLAHVSRTSTLSELSGSLAHELNQPLGIILSNAEAAQELIGQNPQAVGEVREILSDIIAADHRAAEIIQRMRAMLRHEALSLQDLALNAVVDEVLPLVRADLISRGVVVALQLAPGLPQVRGDRVQIQQVVLNLVLNGADAMTGNPPDKRHLYISTRLVEDRVRVSIRDQGHGLPPDCERLFKPFVTTKQKGLGLGLAICQSIIAAHQGRIWAEPHPYCGAVLHFELGAATSPSIA